MAHFAELGADNVVLRVIVISNDITMGDDNVEQESLGTQFCAKLLGGTWVQTSYNANIRKNYAGIGYFYDSGRDAFIPPQPYPSWILVEGTCQWNSPIPYPTDGQYYIWDETTVSWIGVGND